MPAKTVRIEGLTELRNALQELPKATATNTLKRALLKAGQPVVAAVETSAPVLRGTLRASIEVSPKLSKRQKKLTRKESKVEVYIGAGPLPQAHLQEFGSAIHGPQPFLRPAWDSGKKGVLESIKDSLATEIEKARQRLARKAARIAAKNAASR